MSEEVEIELIRKHGFMRCFIEHKFSMKFLIKNAGKFDVLLWNTISSHQHLTESFMNRFKNKLCWKNISSNQKLSSSFIKKNLNLIALHKIGPHNQLPLDFVKENLVKFNFFYLIASRTWKYEDMEYLFKSFLKQDFYVYSKNEEKHTPKWMIWKLEDVKERTSFKISNGGQSELPFIYPHYKSDLNLKYLYTCRVQTNLDLLICFLKKDG